MINLVALTDVRGAAVLRVESYLRVNGRLLSIYDFDCTIPDSNYIEGALSVTVNEIQIVSTDMWDYIDQLWGYIVDGVCHVAQGHSYSCYFPDQPIKLSFEILNPDSIKISLDFDGGESVAITKEEFLVEFTRSGIDFFQVMKSKVPEHSTTWDEYLSRLASIGK